MRHDHPKDIAFIERSLIFEAEQRAEQIKKSQQKSSRGSFNTRRR